MKVLSWFIAIVLIGTLAAPSDSAEKDAYLEWIGDDTTQGEWYHDNWCHWLVASGHTPRDFWGVGLFWKMRNDKTKDSGSDALCLIDSRRRVEKVAVSHEVQDLLHAVPWFEGYTWRRRELRNPTENAPMDSQVRAFLEGLIELRLVDRAMLDDSGDSRLWYRNKPERIEQVLLRKDEQHGLLALLTHHPETSVFSARYCSTSGGSGNCEIVFQSNLDFETALERLRADLWRVWDKDAEVVAFGKRGLVWAKGDEIMLELEPPWKDTCIESISTTALLARSEADNKWSRVGSVGTLDAAKLTRALAFSDTDNLAENYEAYWKAFFKQDPILWVLK